MNTSVLLFAVTMLLASPPSRGQAERSDDLRYCLDLPTEPQIAKCAGQVSPDKKGRPFSKQEVDKILSGEQAVTPAAVVAPATVSDKPAKELTP